MSDPRSSACPESGRREPRMERSSGMPTIQAPVARRDRAKPWRPALWLTWAVFGMAVLSATAASEARSETLADAIARAYESNPTLAAQRAQVRLADEAYVQARAGLRPPISGSSSASYSN